MKAQLIRLLISVLTIVVAGIAFMMIDGWLAWAAAMGLLMVGWNLAEVVFNRLADEETRRADLEDRGRNSSL